MSSWISNWWSKNEKSEVASQMKSADTHTSFIANNVLTEKLTTATIKPRTQSSTTPKKSNDEKTSDDEPIKLSKPNSKSAQCHRPCFTSQDLEYVLKKTCVGKHIPPCKIPCNKPTRSYATSSRKPFYELPRYTMADHGMCIYNVIGSLMRRTDINMKIKYRYSNRVQIIRATLWSQKTLRY